MHSVFCSHLPGGWLASPAQAMALKWHPHTGASCRPAVITCFLRNWSFQKHRLWGRDFRNFVKKTNQPCLQQNLVLLLYVAYMSLGFCHPPSLASEIECYSKEKLRMSAPSTAPQHSSRHHTETHRQLLCQNRAIYSNPASPRWIPHGNILRFKVRRLN